MIVDEHLAALGESRESQDRDGITSSDHTRRLDQPVFIERAREADFPTTGESNCRSDGSGGLGLDPTSGFGEGGRHSSNYHE
jgi:hypothetical protein